MDRLPYGASSPRRSPAADRNLSGEASQEWIREKSSGDSVESTVETEQCGLRVQGHAAPEPQIWIVLLRYCRAGNILAKRPGFCILSATQYSRQYWTSNGRGPNRGCFTIVHAVGALRPQKRESVARSARRCRLWISRLGDQ
jgi:hypothetical protein